MELKFSPSVAQIQKVIAQKAKKKVSCWTA